MEEGFFLITCGTILLVLGFFLLLTSQTPEKFDHTLFENSTFTLTHHTIIPFRLQDDGDVEIKLEIIVQKISGVYLTDYFSGSSTTSGPRYMNFDGEGEHSDSRFLPKGEYALVLNQSKQLKVGAFSINVKYLRYPRRHLEKWGIVCTTIGVSILMAGYAFTR